ncbi:HalOD1 output domain-containing protein [Haloplanus salilacus]|uniref:HalOD1 output domain-containing protein n=1 Tax=Haloplanus salilacus TaxID=2949994 RepID=UPI0030D58953
MDGFEPPDRDEPIAESQYEWSTTRPSAAVVETVAEVTDRETTAFGPLNAAVDPDALDVLVRESESAATDETVVSFLFDEFRVVVRGRGDVVLRAPSD